MTSSYKVGTTYGGMVAFSAMTVPVVDPAAVDFQPYAVQKLTGSGVSVGYGNPFCTLTWNNISRKQRDQLRVYIPAISQTLYWSLPTRESNMTFATYTGQTAWPIEKPVSFRPVSSNLTIVIYNLLLYVP